MMVMVRTAGRLDMLIDFLQQLSIAIVAIAVGDAGPEVGLEVGHNAEQACVVDRASVGADPQRLFACGFREKRFPMPNYGRGFGLLNCASGRVDGREAGCLGLARSVVGS